MKRQKSELPFDITQTEMLPRLPAKSLGELPLDTILTEILPKLPAKSLGRFRCVCKQWKSLLSTQEFIKLHKSRNNEKLLIADPSRTTFYSIHYEPPNYPITTLQNVPFEVNPRHVLLLASLDGLVCVGFKNSQKLMFWNPLTGAFKYLSNSKYHGYAYVPHSDAIGFYYDSLDDCYKILHVNRAPSGPCRAYIYSQRLDTWKEIKFLENVQRFSEYGWSPVTFSNGSLYFTLEAKGKAFQGERLIVISFDVNTEKFKEIQCPSGAKKYTRFCGRLVIVKDCIHLCVSYMMIRDSVSQSELDLWRLNNEQGRTQVESISVNDRYPFQCNDFWIPICILRNGDWLVSGEFGKSFYKINMKTKKLAPLYNRSWLNHDGVVNTIQRAMYIETLVSPNP